MSIKLKLTGFEDILENIKNAGADIDKVAKDVVEQSAETIDSDYRATMRSKGVSERLVNDMPAPRINQHGNTTIGEVGYSKGAYDPNNPSDGYLALFINYGTPRIAPRNFIAEMKKASYPKVKKQQQEALNQVLRDLQS